MKIKLYSILLLAGLWLSQTSCSDDVKEEPSSSANEDIRVSGVTTRANGDVYDNLYFKAFVAASPSTVYIDETELQANNGLYDDTPQDLTFPGGSPYYPLGENEILLFAYSNPLNTSGEMVLTSGKDISNDALLSNQGYRSSDLSTLTTPEGKGTPGSTTDPAEILQFRHVMTQVTVIMKVDSTETPYVDPPPTHIEFTMDGVHENGSYPITALAPTPATEATIAGATSLSGTYTLTEGINYVVPSGTDLVGKKLSKLIIDDYEATPADLNQFTIALGSGQPTGRLIPGYAYTLTFNIRRLGVQSITLTQVNWQAREVEPDTISYTPYELELDLGSYVNTGDDVITKVVLWSSDGREYVGAKNEVSGEVGFVTLPQGTVDSISLYTDAGLLISMPPDNYTYNPTGSTLELRLSPGGMRLLDPNLGNSESNSYLITTPVQVFNMSKELGASYRQMNDIDVARYSFLPSTPTGGLETFTGTYDGYGYRINNLIMTGPALLRRNQGTIKNIHIASGRIDTTGEPYGGSICAENAGTIVACINEARIIGNATTIGGICGLNEAGSEIIGSINTGDIEGGTTIGGICGENQSSVLNGIAGCVNTGDLYREGTTLGGLIGTSIDVSNVFLLNSFWLVGTAAKVIGGDEFPVGIGNVGQSEVAALSPDKLRKHVVAYIEDVEETLELLNDALQIKGWDTQYEYIIDQVRTGTVWPVPVRIN